MLASKKIILLSRRGFSFDFTGNLFLQANAFDHAATWEPGQIGAATVPVVTANVTTGPNGAAEADRIVYPAVSELNNASHVFQAVSVTAVAHTASVWLKGASGGENLYIYGTPNGVTYITSSRITLTTSWTNYIATGTTTATTWYWLIGTDLRDTVGQTATSGGTVYAWGALLRAG